MGAAREPDQADFDLDRFINMFDEAMTSKDPRVIDALRGLMMIVTLTRPESHNSGLHDRNAGPLRRLFEDMNHLHRRLERVENEHSQLVRHMSKSEINYNYKYNDPYEKYSLQAAKDLASQIDQDILARAIGKVNTSGAFLAKGLTKK